jgi:hypothetical protein
MTAALPTHEYCHRDHSREEEQARFGSLGQILSEEICCLNCCACGKQIKADAYRAHRVKCGQQISGEEPGIETKKMKTLKIGDAVKFVDPHGVERDALVTNCWGGTGGQLEYDESKPVNSCINVVYVTEDANKTDSYGRQTEHETSVSHKSATLAPGRYWHQP